MEGTAVDRRKKRRPKCYRRGWRPPGPDMCDLMDSDKSPDFVEKLTYKYKQKCKIESSTDSESETNTEGTFTRRFFKKASDMKLQDRRSCIREAFSVINTRVGIKKRRKMLHRFKGDHKKNRMEFAEGIIREAKAIKQSIKFESRPQEQSVKLTFLDPYDGDSEDIPNLSDYSLNNCSLGDMSCSRVSNSQNSHIPEEVTVQDSSFLKSPEFAKSTSWSSPALETNDVYMQPMSEVKLPVEIVSQEVRDCSMRLSGSSELSVDSRIIPEVQGPRLEHSWFMNIDPPKHVRHLESITRVPLLPARLMHDKDIKLYKPPLFKRKLELPHSECEKIKRKKQHMA